MAKTLSQPLCLKDFLLSQVFNGKVPETNKVPLNRFKMPLEI